MPPTPCSHHRFPASFRPARSLLLPLLLLTVTFSQGGPAALAGTYYVAATGGNDANPGTADLPFKTLQQAASLVDPGDTVIVRDGVYTGSAGDDWLVTLTRSGAPGSYITFKSEHKWGAILDGAGLDYRIINFGPANLAYIRVEGFEFRDSDGEHIKFNNTGQHDFVIRGNRFHHTKGAAVILGSPDTLLIEGNYFHDNGDTWYDTDPNNVNRDHAIYSSATNVIVRNNLFARHRFGWAMQLKDAVGWKIYNNTFAFPNPKRDGHILLWRDCRDITIRNNIFYQPANAAVRQTDGTSIDIVISDNLTDAPAMVSADSVTSRWTVTHNTVATDPHFADPSTDDFRLIAQSTAAIDTGATLAEVTDDYWGDSRPQGSAPDLGADEYVVPVDPPPPPPAPSVLTQPKAQRSAFGSSASFSVTATDATAYQWTHNGAPISGATTATLTLPTIQSADAGTYRVILTGPGGTTLSDEVTLATYTAGLSKLINLSTRSPVGTGDDVQIAGFVVDGSGPKRLLIRSAGPALSNWLAGFLEDPTLTLYQNGAVLQTNDNWSADPTTAAEIRQAASAVSAFPFTDGSRDAAFVVTLQPGSYSAVVSGQAGTTGIALVEVYEVDGAASKLINISTRSLVRPGAEIQAAGFVISDGGPKKVAIRASGPGLTRWNIPGVLADPELTVRQGDTVIAANDNWDASLMPDFEKLQLGDRWANGSADAALVLVLDPGLYTAVVSGKSATTGVALVEIYALD